MSEKTITRAEIADRLVNTIQLSRQNASEIVDAIFEEMTKSLIENGQLKLSSFGTFNIRQKTARVGRNPKTGVEVMITPRKTVSFRASQHLKTKVFNTSVKKQEHEMQLKIAC